MTILSDLISQINALDSNSPTSQIYRVVRKLDDFNTHGVGTEVIRYYDSVGLMPLDSAFIGTLLMSSNGIMYRLHDSGGLVWDSAMSLQPPVTKAVSGAGPSTASGNLQATVAGYVAGGVATGGTHLSSISQYSFTSDGNSTNSGTLATETARAAGQSSSTHGYSSGGNSPNIANYRANIVKFPLVTSATTSEAGNLTVGRSNTQGVSSSFYGYTGGGLTPTLTSVIDKFSFASDGNATVVGNSTSAKTYYTALSGTQYGYICGGYSPVTDTHYNTIEKFSFSVDGNSTNVGTLASAGLTYNSSNNSAENGYVTGGYTTGFGSYSSAIQKFSYASDGQAVVVANLQSVKISQNQGTSSTTSGYVTGGRQPPNTYINVIEKYPFAADNNATDVGDLITAQIDGSAAQH